MHVSVLAKLHEMSGFIEIFDMQGLLTRLVSRIMVRK